MKPFPPLDVLSVSSYLQQSKIEHDIFDSTFSNYQTLTQQILQKKYDEIGIFSNTATNKNVLKLIQFIRSGNESKETTIVVFGPNAQIHAEEYIEYGANMVIIGESEETMKDLINTLSNPLNPFLDKVSGIAFKNYFGKIIYTPERDLIEANVLPFPNRGRIDINKYLIKWKSKHRKTALNINTKYQQRSGQNICDELEEIQNT